MPFTCSNQTIEEWIGIVRGNNDVLFQMISFDESNRCTFSFTVSVFHIYCIYFFNRIIFVLVDQRDGLFSILSCFAIWTSNFLRGICIKWQFAPTCFVTLFRLALSQMMAFIGNIITTYIIFFPKSLLRRKWPRKKCYTNHIGRNHVNWHRYVGLARTKIFYLTILTIYHLEDCWKSKGNTFSFLNPGRTTSPSGFLYSRVLYSLVGRCQLIKLSAFWIYNFGKDVDS